MTRRLAALLAAAWLTGAAAPLCPPTDDAEPSLSPLPHLAAQLHPGATIAVLAVGSVPDLPAAAGRKPSLATPAGIAGQAVRALEASVHGLHVVLTARAGRGLTAADLAGIIRAELARGHYALVIWQTGTVDAIDEVTPDDFYQTLADTSAAVAKAGADLALIGPQYSRFLEENANLQPYLDTLHKIDTLPGVLLFPRYALMRRWAETGAIDLERTKKPDRPAKAQLLHACLGRELARLLLAGSAAATPD